MARRHRVIAAAPSATCGRCSRTASTRATSSDESLAALGVRDADVEPFLFATALALPGWAGMFSRLERHPEEHRGGPPTTLVDFLAVRLLLERRAIERACRALGVDSDWTRLRPRMPAIAPLRPVLAASLLWHVAEAAAHDGRAGRRRSTMARSPGSGPNAWRVRDRRAAPGPARSVRADAIAAASSTRLPRVACCRTEPARDRPRAQFVFCIDEREESIRRALEEQQPGVRYVRRGRLLRRRDRLSGPLRPSARGALPGRRHAGARGARAAGLHRPGLARAAPAPARPLARLGTAHGGRLAHAERRRRACRSCSARLGAADARARGGAARVAGGRRSASSRGSRRAPRRACRRCACDAAHAALERRQARRLLARRGGRPGHGHAAQHRPRRATSRRSSSSSATARRASTTRTSRRTTAARAAGGAAAPTRGSSPRWPTAPTCARACARAASTSRTTRGSSAGCTTPPTTACRYYDLEALPATARRRVRRGVRGARARAPRERAGALPAFRRRAADAIAPDEALRHVEARVAHLAQPRPEYGHCTNAICVVGRRSAHARPASRPPRVPGQLRPRRTDTDHADPRAHPRGGRARRRGHQPRVLLLVGRQRDVRLRHQAAAQRHRA